MFLLCFKLKSKANTQPILWLINQNNKKNIDTQNTMQIFDVMIACPPYNDDCFQLLVGANSIV